MHSTGTKLGALSRRNVNPVHSLHGHHAIDDAASMNFDDRLWMRVRTYYTKRALARILKCEVCGSIRL